MPTLLVRETKVPLLGHRERACRCCEGRSCPKCLVWPPLPKGSTGATLPNRAQESHSPAAAPTAFDPGEHRVILPSSHDFHAFQRCPRQQRQPRQQEGSPLPWVGITNDGCRGAEGVFPQNCRKQLSVYTELRHLPPFARWWDQLGPLPQHQACAQRPQLACFPRTRQLLRVTPSTQPLPSSHQRASKSPAQRTCPLAWQQAVVHAWHPGAAPIPSREPHSNRPGSSPSQEGLQLLAQIQGDSHFPIFRAAPLSLPPALHCRSLRTKLFQSGVLSGATKVTGEIQEGEGNRLFAGHLLMWG
ncbi:uncharacterized protein LOC112542333 [Python bivittatus]|uniref:Uncharacterized protein LOC112542333 n=1 Tax=Python bivittatus TaxID=176946 RepID=A0A9F5N634_PYTBI|nr:uncharacterized protein LOC112542333 [Python bivittatus]